MATTVRSRKAKGFGFQKAVAKDIQEWFNLEESDVVSSPSSCKGVDIRLSKRAIAVFPFACEAKNCESLNIWAALKQAESNATEELIPLVVFKRNHSDPYCAIAWADFLAIIRGFKSYQFLYRELRDKYEPITEGGPKDGV